MLRFAFKNMAVKKARLLLVLLSILISASVALLSYNISMQVQEGIVSTAAYYDMIIGPSGSATQLAMNTMFFTDEPLGTISYSYVEEIEQSGLANAVVPFTMGDSFNSAKIVGTTPDFLEGKTLLSGDMFDDVYEAVVGAAVAQKYSLQVGDTIVTSHGLTGSGAEHAAKPLTVTGILKKTSTSYDNVIFTSYKTVWAVHEHEEEEEHEHEETAATVKTTTTAMSHGALPTAQETEESEEEHVEEGQVCAILVKSKSFNDYYKLQNAYGDNASLLCINPSTVLREVMEQVDLSTEIVYILCGIILVMNMLVISVITLLNMFDSKKEIALMRLIGIRMRTIALLYLLQNGLTAVIAVLLSMVLGHACLSIMSEFVSSMGIVLGVWHVYPMEWAICGAVIVISVLPTMICILQMAKKDGLNG